MAPAMKAYSPQEIVGSFIYLKASVPESVLPVSVIAEHQSDKEKFDYCAAEQLMRYFVHVMNRGVKFSSNGNRIIEADADSSLGNGAKMYSRTGGCVFLANGPISVRASTQKHLATGTQESETYGLSEVIHDTLASKNVVMSLPWSEVNELKKELESAPVVRVDNQAVWLSAPKVVFGKKLRHIALRYYHITEAIGKGEIVLKWVASGENRADILSKRIPSPSVFKRGADRLSGHV